MTARANGTVMGPAPMGTTRREGVSTSSTLNPWKRPLDVTDQASAVVVMIPWIALTALDSEI
jgi:hypothetical protein